jgi:hypothetical protein
MEGIPVPKILQMYLSYWAKFVAKVCRCRASIESMWLTPQGEPLEYKQVIGKTSTQSFL